MGILQITTDVVGQIGVNPRNVKIITTDNLSTVTTANYLNSITLAGNEIYATDVIQMWYSYVNEAHPGTYSEFLPSFSNGIITLEQLVLGGDVLLPVTSGHIATFNGTSGQIKSDGSPAINAGNIQAGLSGTAGHFTSYPATASTGNLSLTAVANSGNYANVISNNGTGQATSWLLPDPGVASAQIAVSPATITSGNLISAQGTLGLVQDSNIAANTVLTAGFASPDTNANIIYGNAANITSAIINTGEALFTPTGSKSYILIQAILNITTAFSGGSDNASLIIGVGSTNLITVINTSLTPAKTLTLGQALFVAAAATFPVITASNPLKIVQASSDYTGGLANLYYVLLRTA